MSDLLERKRSGLRIKPSIIFDAETEAIRKRAGHSVIDTFDSGVQSGNHVGSSGRIVLWAHCQFRILLWQRRKVEQDGARTNRSD